jgi:hypothetical protein
MTLRLGFGSLANQRPPGVQLHDVAACGVGGVLRLTGAVLQGGELLRAGHLHE